MVKKYQTTPLTQPDSFHAPIILSVLHARTHAHNGRASERRRPPTQNWRREKADTTIYFTMVRMSDVFKAFVFGGGGLIEVMFICTCLTALTLVAVPYYDAGRHYVANQISPEPSYFFVIASIAVVRKRWLGRRTCSKHSSLDADAFWLRDLMLTFIHSRHIPTTRHHNQPTQRRNRSTKQCTMATMACSC